MTGMIEHHNAKLLVIAGKCGPGLIESVLTIPGGSALQARFKRAMEALSYKPMKQLSIQRVVA